MSMAQIFTIILGIFVTAVLCVENRNGQEDGERNTERLVEYACENKQLNVQCDSGQVIRLLQANYGRLELDTCNDQNEMGWSVNCRSNASERIILNKCDQKRQCSISASNHIFGDPCYGTIKYLEMQYTCVTENEIRDVSETEESDTNANNPLSVYACENSELSIGCERGKVIQFLHANYGRKTDSKCYLNTESFRISNVNCLSKNSDEIVRERCDHRRNCSITASNVVFGDPCHGTVKYLEVQYLCVIGEEKIHLPRKEESSDNVTLPDGTTQYYAFSCENTKLNIDCQTGKVIQFIQANYGRTSASKCNSTTERFRIENVNCFSRISPLIMRELCDGKRNCVVEASNSVFGDPCHGTIKYLEMQYKCVPDQTPLLYSSLTTLNDEKSAYACEDFKLNIECGKDEKINILQANYGRRDVSKCHFDVWTGNDDCLSSTSSEIVREKCHKKQSCQIEASNSVFGDPCQGTIKYLEMEYLCVPASGSDKIALTAYRPISVYVCENSKLDVKCGDGEVINFVRANYGRTNVTKCIPEWLRKRFWNTECISNNSEEIVREKCDQNQSCSVRASNLVFGDPCIGTLKYLEIKYQCVQQSIPTKPTEKYSPTTYIPTTEPEEPITTPHISTTTEVNEITTKPSVPTEVSESPEECNDYDLECLKYECEEGSGIFAHPTKKNMFIFCINWRAKADTCKDDLVFIEKYMTCFPGDTLFALILESNTN